MSDLLVAVAGGGEVRAGRAVGSVMQPGSVLMSEATDIAPRIYGGGHMLHRATTAGRPVRPRSAVRFAAGSRLASICVYLGRHIRAERQP